MADDYRMAKGWLTDPERDALVDYARSAAEGIAEATIVNIGVEFGASLHCLRHGAPGATLYGIDLNISKLVGDPHAKLIEGNSNDAAVAAMVPKDVDLLFVDGGHDYDTVLGDLRLWAPKVGVGGYLLLHDYSSWELHKGVVDAVAAWERRLKKWKFIELVDTLRIYVKE